MITETSVRSWYTPIEVSTLRRWLVVSFLVNVFLLSVDVLRSDTSNLLYGVMGLLTIGLLLNTLPKEAAPLTRNASLFLGWLAADWADSLALNASHGL